MSTLRTQLAGICGSTSLACWIVVLLPQLIEQWRLQSAEGIAIGFILVWLVGDITNLAGALWAGLRSNVVFLAVWFCFADGLIIASYVYYTYYKPPPLEENDNETEPLLNRRGSDAVLQPIVENTSTESRWVRYGVPVVLVFAAGIVGYFLSSDSGEPPADDPPMPVGAEILGYLSAALYLLARIPQIIRNTRRKSVEGLSLLFFIFSLLGNLTYAGYILLFSTEWDYVVKYMPWLIGSLGTIVEDLIIFAQFAAYNGSKQHHVSAILD